MTQVWFAYDGRGRGAGFAFYQMVVTELKPGARGIRLIRDGELKLTAWSLGVGHPYFEIVRVTL